MFEHSWKNPEKLRCSKCKKIVKENLFTSLVYSEINLCDTCMCLLEEKLMKVVKEFVGMKCPENYITNDECITSLLRGLK